MKKVLFFVVGMMYCVLGVNTKVKASHAAGAELRYDYLGGNTYKFTYTFYRSCQLNAQSEATSVTLCFYSTCDTSSYSVVMPKDTVNNGQPISPNGCPGYPTNCTVGSIPGYQEWKYSKNVTLPFKCSFWKFSVGSLARNQSITNLNQAGGTELYIEATLNNQFAPNNSSAYFNIKPVYYMCANVPITINNGAIDPNGDSLTYEMLQPMNSPTNPCSNGSIGSPISFNNSSSVVYNIINNPLSSGNTFSLDSTTGFMTFTPNMVQIAELSMKVKEWHNGQLVGSTVRDVQYYVMSCLNNPIYLAPIAVITPTSSPLFCAGNSVILHVNNASGLMYQWKKNGVNISGATDSTYTAISSGSYTLLLTNNNCTSTSNNIVVVVEPWPIISISNNGSNYLSTTSNFSGYQWFQNNVAISGATNKAYYTNQIGSYYLVVTDSNGCSNQSNTIIVTVGIKDVSNNSITLSPNPTTGIITIKGITQPSVAVYNLMGQKVVSSQASNEVSLAQLPAGLYMVQVFSKDGELVKSEKVIKE